MKLNFPLERPVTDQAPGKWRPFGVGIDVHKEMVWACVLRADYKEGTQDRSVCKFETSPASRNTTRRRVYSPPGLRRQQRLLARSEANRLRNILRDKEFGG